MMPQQPGPAPALGAPMGAPNVAATPPPAAASPLQLSAEEMGQWWTRVDLARSRRKRESEKWKTFLNSYLPAVTANPEGINSNIHFRNVHLKIAEVWAQLPQIQLTPLEPLDGIMDPKTGQPMPAEDIAAVKRAILNKELGPDNADLDQAITAALFDIFATSGVGATKICYEADIQQTPMEMPGPSTQMPGAVLGLQDVPGPTVTQMVPVPVHERFRWYRFSTSKLLIPHDYHSTDFDEAPWLGMEGVMPLAQAKKKYGLPDDFSGNATRDDMIIESGSKDPTQGSADLVKFVEIWLHANVYDPEVAHSQKFRVLTLIEGLKEKPAEYRESPYQTIGPDHRLTADSMVGNPIHPIVLRQLSDTAWVPADAAFTDPLVKIENTWMSQTVKARDANIPRFVHSDSIKEAIDKLKDADVGQGVGIDDALAARGIATLIAPIPHLEHAASDTAGHALIRRAMDETLGLGANQAGGINNTVRSATEVATVQANVSVRLKGEQNQLLKRVLQGVRKFDSLIQRYQDKDGYIQIVGQGGAKKLVAYNQAMLSGRYAYEATVGSQLALDPDRRMKKVLDFVNFLAKSPWMDQGEMARLVTNEFGYDTARMIRQPQPPPPEAPNVSFRFGGPDLGIPEVRALLAAQNPAMAEIFAAPPSPEAIMAQQTELAKHLPHGGTADKADVLSKHSSEETGAMPGHVPSGAPPAAATPGRVQ